MMTNNETVVMTGATGFIAMHCIPQLLEAGHRARGTSCPAFGCVWQLCLAQRPFWLLGESIK